MLIVEEAREIPDLGSVLGFSYFPVRLPVFVYCLEGTVGELCGSVKVTLISFASLLPVLEEELYTRQRLIVSLVFNSIINC